MKPIKTINILVLLIAFVMSGCTDIAAPEVEQNQQELEAVMSSHHGPTGVLVVNGWYEEEEIYYIDLGIENGVTERGGNDIYLIGGARLHQANVVEFIPGESGYTPHWNVHVVHTAPGTTVADILASPYASSHFDSEGVLFDDVADILGAYGAGLVTIDRPGVVVLCPITPETTADAPGNREAPEVFDPFGETF